ncbi:MAG: glycosyltransferase family 39 protein [Eubacteriales bacterium]|nr:glycosyltransferase family 39 protein [Eubacteriales bacterium]
MKTQARSVLVVLIFVLMLAVGLANFSHYGISTDEEACHYRAIVNANYLTELVGQHIYPENVPDLQNYVDKDHGVITDLIALGFEQIFDLRDSKDIFLFKHFYNFLLFWLSLIAFYQLARRRFNSWGLGLLAAIFLFLSPRLFADAFYNPKDLVFMSLFLIAMNSSTAFLKIPSRKNALVLAFTTALAISTRIMGIVIIPTLLILLIIKAIRDAALRKSILINTAIYIFGSLLLTLLFWPMLWANPLQNFMEAFSNLSQFTRWEKNILLMGKFYLSTELPWFFVPVWISITTPLLYLLLFATGIGVQVKRQLFTQKMKFWKDDESLQDLFFLMLFFGPILSVILLNSVLYDGWRQMYFIYPSLILIALTGLQVILDYINSRKSARIIKLAKRALSAIVFSSLLFTSIWMYQANPMQNVYFNLLAGNNWRSNYDLDYWGLANREALEFIVANDPSPSIQISSVSASSVEESFRIIELSDRKRLNYIEYEPNGFLNQHPANVPIYVFNNYKRVEIPDILDHDPRYEVYYQKIVDHEIILTVYKLK